MLAPAGQASAVPLSHTLDSSPVTSVFSEQLPYHLKLSPRLCLCFLGRFGVGSGSVSEVSQSCVAFVLTEFSSPSFGVSWDHPDRCSCQLSAFALLCLVSQPVMGLSSSCPSAPVPPGTALVSCTACEGRSQLKERLKRLWLSHWLSHCGPHPTTLALGLGSEVFQLQPPPSPLWYLYPWG